MSVLTERFMQTLSTQLQEYQRDHNVLITVAPAVVSGAADITGEIQSAVAQKWPPEGGSNVPTPAHTACPVRHGTGKNPGTWGKCTPLPSRTC